MSRSLADTTALILAGGLGTRLRSVISDRPKVLAPVAGRPYLAHLLDMVSGAGVRRVVLCTGYRAAQVQSTFGTAHGGMSVTYSAETTPCGTAGALRLALPQVESKTVLVLNGDSYCDVDLTAFWSFHQRHRGGAGGSLVLAQVSDTRRYGRVSIDAGGRITAFQEKAQTAGSGLINAGVYLLNTDLIGGVPEGDSVSLERDLFPRWMASGLYGFATADAFIDIGTPESYAAADLFFLRLGRAA